MQRNPVDGHSRTSLASPGEQPLHPTLAQATRYVPKRGMSRVTLLAGIWQQVHKPGVVILSAFLRKHTPTPTEFDALGEHTFITAGASETPTSWPTKVSFKVLRAVEARHPSWRRCPCIQVRGAHTSHRRPSSIKMPISPTGSTPVVPNLFAKLRLRGSARQPQREAPPRSAGVLLPIVCAACTGDDSAAFSDVAASAAPASPLFLRASKLRLAAKDLGSLHSTLSREPL